MFADRGSQAQLDCMEDFEGRCVQSSKISHQMLLHMVLQCLVMLQCSPADDYSYHKTCRLPDIIFIDDNVTMRRLHYVFYVTSLSLYITCGRRMM